MLKRFLVIGFILLASSNAWALSIQAGDTVKMLNDSTVPYSLKTSDGTTYSTFCLESQQEFTPNGSYIVESIGDYAYGGGGGADADGRDQVSTETKWLYAAYMSDVFRNVRNANNKVQTAIWYLEEEIGGSQSAWNALKDYTFDATGWTVVAVNITRNGVDNQSQLLGEKTAPVPEPATLFLLGSGLIGLIGSRRKKN